MWLPPNCNIESEPKGLKILTISVWFLFGSILLTIVFILLPPGWLQILWGALIVIAGSAGSQLLPDWKKHEHLRWVRAVCIGIVVAIGALTTTHGWNVRDNYLRDRARYVAMATELHLNQICLELLSLAHQEYIATGDSDVMTALPLPSTHQIRQVLHLSNLHKKDAKFADTIVTYMIASDLLSANIEKIDRVCAAHIVSREMVSKLVQSIFEQGHIFSNFRKVHMQLAGQLVAKYDWSFQEAGTRVRKPLLDAFYMTITQTQGQLRSLEWEKRMKQLRDSLQQRGGLIPIPNDNLNSRTGQDPND